MGNPLASQPLNATPLPVAWSVLRVLLLWHGVHIDISSSNVGNG
jgi:hypothetical protein